MIKATGISIAAVALLAPGACDPRPTAAQNAAAAAAAARVAEEAAQPAFALQADAVTKLVDDLGKPWAGAKTEDGVDARSGGAIRMVTADKGSAQIFSRTSGKVWQLRLIDGGPGKCTESAALKTALPGLVKALAPDVELSKADQNALDDGLSGLAPKTKTMDGMEVTVQGGCAHWLTLKAV